MTKLQRNLLVAPIVVFIRVPLLLPLWALVAIGEWAETAGNFISDYIPGFKS